MGALRPQRSGRRSRSTRSETREPGMLASSEPNERNRLRGFPTVGAWSSAGRDRPLMALSDAEPRPAGVPVPAPRRALGSVACARTRMGRVLLRNDANRCTSMSGETPAQRPFLGVSAGHEYPLNRPHTAEAIGSIPVAPTRREPLVRLRNAVTPRALSNPDCSLQGIGIYRNALAQIQFCGPRTAAKPLHSECGTESENSESAVVGGRSRLCCFVGQDA
jgi:hypothetical protein